MDLASMRDWAVVWPIEDLVLRLGLAFCEWLVRFWILASCELQLSVATERGIPGIPNFFG